MVRVQAVFLRRFNQALDHGAGLRATERIGKEPIFPPHHKWLMQIALYGLAYWQELQPARLPEDTYRELQLLARQYYQMTSLLIKAKVDFNAICDQVLPGMQELMNDHAGRHKLSDFVLRYCHTTHTPASMRRRTSPANSARITGISPSGEIAICVRPGTKSCRAM